MQTTPDTYNTPLTVKFRNHKPTQYGTEIAITITEDGKERQHHTKRTFQVNYIAPKYALHQIAISLLENQLTYSGALKKSQDFIAQLGALYNNLSLYINWNGSIHSILNPTALQQRWKTIRTKAEKRYKGNAVQTYLDNVAHNLQDKDKILQEVSAYRFLGLLFPGLCNRESQQDFQRNTHTTFLKGETIKITETFHAQTHQPEAHTVKWMVEGTQHQEDTQPYTIDHYQGYITLNTQNGWVEAATLHIKIKDETRTKQTLYTVKRIP